MGMGPYASDTAAEETAKVFRRYSEAARRRAGLPAWHPPADALHLRAAGARSARHAVRLHLCRSAAIHRGFAVRVGATYRARHRRPQGAGGRRRLHERQSQQTDRRVAGGRIVRSLSLLRRRNAVDRGVLSGGGQTIRRRDGQTARAFLSGRCTAGNRRARRDQGKRLPLRTPGRYRRRGRQAARRRPARGPLCGPDGIRRAGPGQPLDPGRSQVAGHRAGDQSHGQEARFLDAVRSDGQGRSGSTTTSRIPRISAARS